MNKQNRTEGGHMGGDFGGWMKEAKALRGTNWQLHYSIGDVKQSIENIVNNIVITICDTWWILRISGGTHCKVYGYLTTTLYT